MDIRPDCLFPRTRAYPILLTGLSHLVVDVFQGVHVLPFPLLGWRRLEWVQSVVDVMSRRPRRPNHQQPQIYNLPRFTFRIQIPPFDFSVSRQRISQNKEWTAVSGLQWPSFSPVTSILRHHQTSMFTTQDFLLLLTRSFANLLINLPTTGRQCHSKCPFTATHFLRHLRTVQCDER